MGAAGSQEEDGQLPEPAAGLFSYVGTSTQWVPQPMTWDAEGSCFQYILTIGMNKWEAFQILGGTDWDARIYPSCKSADPSKPYEIKGPDSSGEGFDWLVGGPRNFMGKGKAQPGTRYKVAFYVNAKGEPQHLSWDLYDDNEADRPVVPKHFSEDLPRTFAICGSWSGYQGIPMKWNGECFEYMVRVGKDGKEKFQLLIDNDPAQVLCPSKDNAHPYMKHTIEGPEEEQQEFWAIKTSGERIKTGTKYKVKLFVDSRWNAKRVTWDMYLAAEAQPHTVICFAGLASSSLECKQEGSDAEYIVNWCNVGRLVGSPATVFKSLSLRLVEGTLKDGTAVQSTACAEGYDVQPVQGMEGIKDLNPRGKIPVPVWGPLIEELESDFKWHAFNYDWRRWGDLMFVEQLAERFQREVEEAIQSDAHVKGKASLIGHSMGASVILYLLSVVDEEWVTKYIENVVLVAPAHTGSPSMVSSFAFCPFVDTASWFPVPSSLNKNLGDLTSTWACMVAEFPVKVGEISPYPEEHAFAVTSNPEKRYTMDNIGEFLEDLQGSSGKREVGPAMWPHVEKIASSTKIPRVPTAIIYGADVQTPYQVTYDSSDLSVQPKLTETVAGDGTIVASSVEIVAQAWLDKGAPVRLLKDPGRATSHKDLICCPFTIGVIPKILTSTALTPVRVTIIGASDLKNADIGSLSDPYCVAQVPGKPSTELRTQVIQDNLNPRWDFEGTIYAYDEGEEIIFTVYDMDSGLTLGDLLGETHVSGNEIKNGFNGEKAFDAGEQGSLKVKVEMLPPWE